MMERISLAHYDLPKQQFNSQFIENYGVILLEEKDDAITIGVIKDGNDSVPILQQHYPNKVIIQKLIDELELSTFLSRQNHSISDTDIDVENLEPMALASAPHFIRLVNTVLSNAIQNQASDIHIEGFSKYCIVRYRLDGILQEVERFESSQFKAIASRLKIMAGLNIMETRLPQDGRLTYNQTHMRISIIPLAAGESIVLRILEKDAKLLNLEHLGFSNATLSILKSITERKHGLFIVTGPTGSGKTTTLTSLLATMNYQEKKIISLEDPIEYVIDGIDQVQIHEDVGLTFSSLLRRCLRQDPDVILIGEMRDKESADLAIRSALTGHLVLSTLHTNNALGAITRLKNMEIESYLIADVLIAVLSQRLIRILCPECKEPSMLSNQELDIFKNHYQEAVPTTIYQSKGCPHCRNTGYKGRSVVEEIFTITKDVYQLIQNNISEGNIMEQLKKDSFLPIAHQALRYVANGKTTIQEVMPIIYE